MKESDRPGHISRRDAIRLLPMSATLVAAAVTASSIPNAAWAAVSASCETTAHGGQDWADTAQDLAKLAAEHFEPLVGETFTIGDNAVMGIMNGKGVVDDGRYFYFYLERV